MRVFFYLLLLLGFLVVNGMRTSRSMENWIIFARLWRWGNIMMPTGCRRSHWYYAPEMKEHKFSQSTMPFIFTLFLLTANICFGGTSAFLSLSAVDRIHLLSSRGGGGRGRGGRMEVEVKARRPLLFFWCIIWSLTLTMLPYHPWSANKCPYKIKRIIDASANTWTRTWRATHHTLAAQKHSTHSEHMGNA